MTARWRRALKGAFRAYQQVAEALEARRREFKNDPVAQQIIRLLEAKVIHGRDLLKLGAVKEAAEILLPEARTLNEFSLTLSLAYLRGSNQARKSMRGASPQWHDFFNREIHLLDEAEALLEAGKADAVRKVIEQLHQEKVHLGLAGPIP